MAGRAKEMIISGGENVYPKEIEDVLSEHPAVAEVAVIGVPDPVYEERVVALVRRLPAAGPVESQELRDFVRVRLAGFKTPKEVRFVDDFPRTGLGKIAKDELARTWGSVFDA
jgi:acyl-CoA synthetase (AMP-forming)/AMP-acid ligase II